MLLVCGLAAGQTGHNHESMADRHRSLVDMETSGQLETSLLLENPRLQIEVKEELYRIIASHPAVPSSDLQPLKAYYFKHYYQVWEQMYARLAQQPVITEKEWSSVPSGSTTRHKSNLCLHLPCSA